MNYSTKMRTYDEIKKVALKDFIFGKDCDENTKVKMATFLLKPGKTLKFDKATILVPDEKEAYKELATDEINRFIEHMTLDIDDDDKLADLHFSEDCNVIRFTSHNISVDYRDENVIIKACTEFVGKYTDQKVTKRISLDPYYTDGFTLKHVNLNPKKDYYIHIIFAKLKIIPIIVITESKEFDLNLLMDKSYDFLFNSLKKKITTKTITETSLENIKIDHPLNQIESNLKDCCKNFETVKYNDNGDVIEYKRDDKLSMTCEIGKSDNNDYDEQYHRVVNFGAVILEDTTKLINNSNKNYVIINNRNGKTVRVNNLTENIVEEIIEIGDIKTTSLYNNGKLIDSNQVPFESDSMFKPYLVEGTEESGDYKIMIEPNILMHVYHDNDSNIDKIDKYYVNNNDGRTLLFCTQSTFDSETVISYKNPFISEDLADKFYFVINNNTSKFESTCGLRYSSGPDGYEDNDMKLKSYQGIDGNLIYECESYLYDKDHLYIRDEYGIPTKLIVD